jgi:hypothetical protein
VDTNRVRHNFRILIVPMGRLSLISQVSMKVRNSSGKPSLSTNETKYTRKDKSGGLEKLTQDDFDRRVIMMKSIPLTSLQESRIRYKPFPAHAVLLSDDLAIELIGSRCRTYLL